MTPFAYRPLMLAGFILFALPACAATPPDASMATTSSSMAVDLGPSTRIPTTRLAMADAGVGRGAGHETSVTVPRAQPVQLARDGGTDAHATGTVNSVNAAQHKINLSHTPIPSIGWPAMTMDFAVTPTVDLTRVRPGSRVNFSMQKGKGGMYEVQSIEPAGAGQ
jgi:Cu/Ag efflux protein CusF